MNTQKFPPEASAPTDFECFHFERLKSPAGRQINNAQFSDAIEACSAPYRLACPKDYMSSEEFNTFLFNSDIDNEIDGGKDHVEN